MREEMPQLEPDDMPKVWKLPEEELKKLPFESWRLFCGIEGCNRFTHVKDFGVWPRLYGRFAPKWINIRVQRFFCAVHWKMYGGEFGTPPVLPYKDYSIDEVRKTIMEKSGGPAT